MDFERARASFIIALRAEGQAPRTIQGHLEGIDRFFRKFPHALDTFGADHIRLFLGNPRWGAATRRLRWKGVKAFFAFCVGEGWLATSPVDAVPCPKPGKARKPPPYEPEEIEAILAACMYPGRAPWVGLRNQALIMCLATTPARVSALCRVLVTEVDFRTEEITFHDKGGVTYKAVLFPETARAIDRYKNARPFDVASLFVSDNGTQLTAQAVRQMMKRLKKALGITKPLYPHLFRHRFGMQTVLWNLSLDEAARAMGHRSTKATEIYRQWVSEDAAMAKIHRIVSARTA